MKTYKEQNSLSFITLLVGIIGIFILIYMQYSDSKNSNYYKVGLFLFIITTFLFHILRPRKCPNCGKKMKMDLTKGFPPEFYVCKDCDIQIKTFIQRDSSL